MKILEFDLSAKGFMKALPFWISYALIPVAWISAFFGGWFLFLLPLLTWFLFSILDFLLGLQNANEDPLKDDKKLGLYQLTTILWAPIQFLTIFGILFFVSSKNHLTGAEQLGLFFGLGIISGTVGINYSHELMHQRSKLERWMAMKGRKTEKTILKSLEKSKKNKFWLGMPGALGIVLGGGK